MLRKAVVIFVSLMIMFLIADSVEALGKGRLIGRVEDPDGNPVEGVTVQATAETLPDFNEVRVTDEKGVFKLDFDDINVVYTYVFSKPGFVTMKTEQNWQKDGKARHTFIIFPGEDVAVGGVVPVTDSIEAAAAYNEGVRAFEANDFPGAEAKLEEALEHDPELRQGWVALSVVEYQQNDFAEAVVAAEKAIELGSTDELVLRTRWDSYRQLGDEAKAAEAQADLEQTGMLAEEAKRIYNEGVQLLKAGDAEGAYRMFQEALQADPNLQPALFAVATTGLESGHYQEAFDAAEAILRDEPGNEDAIKLRYNASLGIGDEGLITGSLVSLAAIEPEIARENLLHLAMASYNANDMEKAKERFSKVLQVDPNNAQAHYLLGLIYLGEGDAAKADVQKHLERFLELAPDDPDADSARDILEYLNAS